MSQLIHVTGLSDLQRFLDELPAKIERNVLRGAVRAGANVIKNEAKAVCPVGPPSATGARRYKLYEGALRDSIRVSVKAKGGRVTASIKAGGKLKNGADVWYAHIVERGAVAHKISAKKGGFLAIGGGVYRKVDHPGIKPQPFMRPALDARAQDAVVAAGEYMKQRLASRHGLDTSDVQIGGAL